MIKRIRETNTRTRVVFSAIICALAVVLLTTPLFSWITQLATSPSQVFNLQVDQRQTDVTLSWQTAVEIDIKEYRVEFGEATQTTSSTSINLTELTYPLEVRVFAVDFFGSSSQPASFSLETMTPSEITREFSLNDKIENNVIDSNTVFIRAGILALVSLFLTLYIFRFNIVNRKSLIILVYPSFVIFPYALLGMSFFATTIQQVNQFLLSFVFGFIVFFISYFIFLTINILNTSLEVKLPLEQAAKASQFIFSLIASYIILLVVFSSGIGFFERLILVLPFIFFYTFSAIVMLENITPSDALARSLSIVVLVGMATFVLSIWPLEFIYSILCIAILYYILLSISLEVKALRLQRYVWMEYLVLISLMSLLLLLNSSWGINGTLL